jgi:hypothetical protein
MSTESAPLNTSCHLNPSVVIIKMLRGEAFVCAFEVLKEIMNAAKSNAFILMGFTKEQPQYKVQMNRWLI